MNKLRCSMLPTAQDCTRRAIAGQFRKIIIEAGYQLNEKRKAVYTVMGVGTHSAGKFMLSNKITTGFLPSIDDCIEVGIDEYYKELSDSQDIIFDKITTNKKYGEYQIQQMVKYYYKDVAPKMVFPENINPDDYLEVELKVTLNGFEISGHVDVITLKSLCDTKSGALLRPYHTQLGGYENLAISNDYPKHEHLIINHLPRVHPDKIYPGVKNVVYDVDHCINESWFLINQLIRDVKEFEKVGNPAIFQANPQSTLCNEKYCMAFGTDFCRYCGE